MLPDCALPEVFLARAGGPVADVRFLQGPAAGVRRLPAKDVLGEDLAHHLDGTNFSVQWDDDGLSDEVAEALLMTAEAGWTALVTDGGWPGPVSSDRYLLRIVLDPELGATGWTTEYEDEAYPDGYPVMFVNPSYFDDYPDFVRSVVLHEFGHALQYALRSWAATDAEAWYWEASAEWIAELGDPDLDEYARSAAYYASQTTLDYDSRVNAHHYGMMLVDASLAVDGVALLDVWEDSGATPWDERIAEVAGMDFADVIATMATRYVAGELPDAEHYAEATPTLERPRVPTGEALDLGDHGTAIVALGDAAGFGITGPVRMDFLVDGSPADPPESGPATVLLTRTGDGDILFGAEGEEALAEAGCGCDGGGAPPTGLSLGAGALFVAASRVRLSRRARAAPRPRWSAPPAATAAAPGSSPARA